MSPLSLREPRDMARAGTASGTSLGWAGKVPKPARVRKIPKLFQTSGKAAQELTRGLALLLLRLDPKLHPKRTGICTEKWEWVRKPQTLPGSGKIPRRFHCPKFFFFPQEKASQRVQWGAWPCSCSVWTPQGQEQALKNGSG